MSPMWSACRDGRWGLLLLAWAAASAQALDRPTYLGPKPPAQVKRVVTLAPSLTETVVALGARERLVGVSRYDELPEVKALPRVGGFVDPSVEAVVALKPDLVLVQPAPGNRQPVEKMAELGVPVLALPLHSVAGAEQAIREVGRVLGLSERAEVLVRNIGAARQRARELSLGQKPVRVLFVYGFSPLVVAGPGSFAHELLSDVGAVNAAEGASSPFTVYSAERALKSRPDVVVDAADSAQGREQLEKLPGLREARWVKVPSKRLLQPGPRLDEAVDELMRLVRPMRPRSRPGNPLASPVEPSASDRRVRPPRHPHPVLPRSRAER